ncbi:MAG: hypothetical protein FK733_17995 [Asgard group archaeon]|nr:hypothetical protein [Asgard group archaeon]
MLKKRIIVISAVLICVFSQFVILAMTSSSGKLDATDIDLEVENINSPSIGAEINSWDLSRNVMYVCDEIVYRYFATHVYFMVKNTSDPENMVPITIDKPSGTGHVTSITGNSSYTFVSYEDDVFSDPCISVIKIEEGFNAQTCIINATLDFIKMSLANNQLFVLAHNSNKSTLEILCYNVADPENPIYLGNYTDIYGTTSGMNASMIVDNEYVYLSRNDSSLTVVDFTNPASPTLVKEHSSLVTSNLAMTSQYLIAGNSQGLIFYNKSDLTNLPELATYSMVAPDSIAVKEGLVVVTAEDKLYVLDISDINVIEILDEVKGGMFGEVFVENSRVYIQDTQGPFLDFVQPSFYIFDISDPSEVIKLYHNELDHSENFLDLITWLLVGSGILILVISVTVIVSVIARIGRKNKKEQELVERKLNQIE